MAFAEPGPTTFASWSWSALTISCKELYFSRIWLAFLSPSPGIVCKTLMISLSLMLSFVESVDFDKPNLNGLILFLLGSLWNYLKIVEYNISTYDIRNNSSHNLNTKYKSEHWNKIKDIISNKVKLIFATNLSYND